MRCEIRMKIVQFTELDFVLRISSSNEIAMVTVKGIRGIVPHTFSPDCHHKIISGVASERGSGLCGSSEEIQERDTVTCNRPVKSMEKHVGFRWSNMLSEKTCGKGETWTESTSLMKIRKKNERTVSERKADSADLTLLTRGQPDLNNTVLKWSLCGDVSQQMP